MDMVCLYCGGATHVANSRLQKQANAVWRRRQCEQCGLVFTTQEAAALNSGLRVRGADNVLRPFSRDHLFASIYESCKHRPQAVSDAGALTQTVITKLLGAQSDGLLKREHIVAVAREVLQRFDPAAAIIYAAYHSAAR